MPATHPQPPSRSLAMPLRGGLRPDLAAFFTPASRELAPRRVAAEHGVLAELRAIWATD